MIFRLFVLLTVSTSFIANARYQQHQFSSLKLSGCKTHSLLAVRGGDALGNSRSLYELNPHYVPRVVTMQDLEENPQLVQEPQQQQQQQPLRPFEASFQYHSAFPDPYRRNSPQTLSDSIRFFFTQLYRISPSLFMTLSSCLAIFCCWQTPIFQRSTLARTYFICNKPNRRVGKMTTASPLAIVLASVSHSGALHLLMNLSALLTFGIPVKQALQKESALLILLLGAAVIGNISFLLLDRNHGGGVMGLSGVTCALLAFYCRLYPNKQLGMLVAGIFPVRLQAITLLKSMILTSVLGTFVPTIKSRIAHAAHLGGLLYGTAYHEAWRQRHAITRSTRAIWKKRFFLKM